MQIVIRDQARFVKGVIPELHKLFELSLFAAGNTTGCLIVNFQLVYCSQL